MTGPPLEALDTAVGWAVHDLTTSITHKRTTPGRLDEDCAVLGQAIVGRIAVALSSPETTPAPDAGLRARMEQLRRIDVDADGQTYNSSDGSLLWRDDVLAALPQPGEPT